MHELSFGPSEEFCELPIHIRSPLFTLSSKVGHPVGEMEFSQGFSSLVSPVLLKCEQQMFYNDFLNLPPSF